MINARLETFLEVCKYMNYTRAAESLHITQPAVSQQIRYLEEYYDAKLFTQTGRKISLTTAGEILLKATLTMQSDENKLHQKIRDSKTGRSSITFGCTMTIAEFVLAGSLSHYIKENPNSDLHMIMGNTSDLIGKLRAGDIQFALVEGYFNRDDFECMKASTERYIPVCAASHKFNKKVEVFKDLLGESLIIREPGSGTREILEKNLAVHNLTTNSFKRIMEIGSMQTLVQLLTDDCGISFLYEAAARDKISKGFLREIKLKDFKMYHDFTFIWNKDSTFTKDYEKICGQFIL